MYLVRQCLQLRVDQLSTRNYYPKFLTLQTCTTPWLVNEHGLPLNHTLSCCLLKHCLLQLLPPRYTKRKDQQTKIFWQLMFFVNSLKVAIELLFGRLGRMVTGQGPQVKAKQTILLSFSTSDKLAFSHHLIFFSSWKNKN